MQNDIYAELMRLSAVGEEAALATVISAAGSTQRGRGQDAGESRWVNHGHHRRGRLGKSRH